MSKLRDFVSIDMTPDILKQKRLELKMTQKEMADMIGVTPAAICHMEKGRATHPMILFGYAALLEKYEQKKGTLND